jgi:carboxymethylenebutenolidase
MAYEGMIAETVSIRGHNDDVIEAYYARPLGAGPFPGVIVIHHAPGVPDDQVMADLAGAVAFLREQPYANGRVGAIGFCSGGRHAYLAASRVEGLDAAVDCWGGGVIVDDPAQLSDKRPVAPIEYTDQIACPLLGIFGNEDRSPTPEQVDRTEEALKRAGKTYEFHRYDGAGHGFWANTGPGYRPEQTQDSWKKVLAFYEKHLS